MRQPSDKLTTKQQLVYEFMCNFLRENGYAPSLQELADGLYIAKTTAHAYVRMLEKKGYIHVQESKARAIKFLKVGS